MFVRLDEIARAARSKCETHIDAIQWNGKSLQLTLSGRAETDAWLRVFHDKGNDCTEQFYKIVPFDGMKRVTFKKSFFTNKM